MSGFIFPENIIPENDEIRLKKLKNYEILDTPNETAFDTVTLLATQIFNVPNAYITFVGKERIFFKANTDPLIANEYPRSRNFFSLAILNKAMLINDSYETPDLNISSTSETGNFRFFASAPLKTVDGYVLGSLSVADRKPGNHTTKELEMLQMLATVVMEKLELRLASRKTLRAHDDRLHMLVHDLKNPMTTLSLQSELIGRMPNVDEKVALIAGKMNQQSKNIVISLNNILSAARAEHGSIKMQKSKVDLKAVLDRVLENFSLLSENKRQSITSSVKEPVEIYGDQEKLYDIFENLVSNALKYSAAGKEIKISLTTVENNITVSIKDDGLGLHEEDLNSLFIKFAKLSAVPTASERSNGLGLSIVKMLVDLHKGKVWAESEGKNKGTTFFVELPIK
jgi:signal transduction histidine kinase